MCLSLVFCSYSTLTFPAKFLLRFPSDRCTNEKLHIHHNIIINVYQNVAFEYLLLLLSILLLLVSFQVVSQTWKSNKNCWLCLHALLFILWTQRAHSLTHGWAEQAQCNRLIVMFAATARKLITVFTTLFAFNTYLNLTIGRTKTAQPILILGTKFTAKKKQLTLLVLDWFCWFFFLEI